MAMALATALLSAAPKDPSENVREALDEVSAALATLEKRREERRPAAAPAVDPRPVDALVDRAWSALYSALDSHASLPTDLYPRAAEAAALRDRIFVGEQPRAFLRLRYAAEWAEVKAHLNVIDEQKLEPRLNKLLGPDFLDEIRRTFELYGAALGITTPAPPAIVSESLLEPLRSLTAALNDYVIAVLATVRRNKPETRNAAAAALEPILRLRRPSASPGSPTPSPQDDPSPPA
jgi:hypothetical protein